MDENNDVYEVIDGLVELLTEYLVLLNDIRYITKNTHLDIEYWKKKYVEIADSIDKIKPV